MRPRRRAWPRNGDPGAAVLPGGRPLDDILAELMPQVVSPDFDGSRLDAILCASTSIGGFPGVSQRALVRLRAMFPAIGDPFVLI